ncbi:hypothetical protein A2U01_0050208, partial [Trifolium medium]|nr:hypothetical protein [Trifolium medium]
IKHIPSGILPTRNTHQEGKGHITRTILILDEEDFGGRSPQWR